MSAFDVSVVYRVKNLVSAPLKKIKTGVTDVGQGFKKARQPLESFSQKFTRATTKMRTAIRKLNLDVKKISKGMRNVGLGMTLAISAPVAYMAVGLKNAARDAVETRSKYAVVFKSITNDAERMAESLAKSYGLTGTKSRELIGDTGDILTGFGFTQKEALDLSVEVNSLAADLASFTNYSGGVEGASAALTKALLGEAESVKALGIVIRQDTAEYKEKIEQIMAAEGVELTQAKALAALRIAVSQSKNAIGDFARTSEELANQERITASAILDTKEAFGRILLPVALKITKVIGSLAQTFTKLSPRAKKIILVMAGVAAALAPIILLIGTIGVMLPFITTGFATLGVVMGAVFSPITLIVLAIAAAAFLIIKNWDTLKSWFSAFFGFLQNTIAFKVIRLQINAIIFVFRTLFSLWGKVIGSIADTSAV